ncbi:MAG: MutS-related protein [Limnochordia bacterium]|jgi:hypothetical protein
MNTKHWTTMQYVLAGAAAICGYSALLLGQRIAALYYTLFVPAAVLAALAYRAYSRTRRLKALAHLRDRWGKEMPIPRSIDEHVRAYFDSAVKPEEVVDDRTWKDLNMDEVFGRMDRTLTYPGRQVLYRMLRIPFLEHTGALQKRAAVIRLFQQDKAIREDVQLAFGKLGDKGKHHLAALLWTEMGLRQPRLRHLYTFMYAAALVSPAAVLLGRWGIQVILAVFFTNMAVHYSEQKRNRGHFEAVKAVAALIRCGEALCRTERDWGPLRSMVTELREVIPKVRGFARAAAQVDVESSDPFLGTLLQYGSIFFLTEVRGFSRAVMFVIQRRNELQRLFEIVGEIDACQAVASYRESLRYYCEPELREDAEFELEAAYHPLVQDPVPNSIKPLKNCVLVTGSNMSGKSTFLRTVGLSALLAQTVYTVCAETYRARPMRLITSIGRADNVVEGKSYYLEEALAVLRVLQVLDSRRHLMCIFDELYRGTNSEERITAAYRVVKYIAKHNALVFVATHDLELTEMLAQYCQNVHFSERVSDIGLEFDYKLKPGPATTRNAIALLRYLNYPAEITDPEPTVG